MFQDCELYFVSVTICVIVFEISLLRYAVAIYSRFLVKTSSNVKVLVGRYLAVSALCLLAACGGGADQAAASGQSSKSRANTVTTTSLSAASYTTVVQQLYVSYFGRPADTGGFANFTARMAEIGAPTDIQQLNQTYRTNPKIRELVDSFATSSESASLYSGDDTAFVTAIYANILGRAPDTEGLAWWVGELKSGVSKRSDVSLSIMAGALLNTSAQGKLDAAVVEKKISLATSFTTMLGVTSVNGYAGDAAAAKGRAMLTAVTSSTSSGSLSSMAGKTVGDLGRTAQPNGTVVMRFVGTTHNWGQGADGKEAWINATPTKTASGYKLYDVRLSTHEDYHPTRVDMWDFSDWSTSKFSLSDAAWKTYLSERLLHGEALDFNYSWKEGSYDLNTPSKLVLASLKKAVDVLAAREQPARIIVQYAGHGASWTFFDGKLRQDDGRLLLQYIREKMLNSTLILDFSTNCQVSYYEFFAKFYDVADYLLASEQNYGGYSIGDFNDWLKVDHFQNSHTLFGADKSLPQVFSALVASREGVWRNASVSLNEMAAAKNHDMHQSFSAFDLRNFGAMMKMVAAIPNFNPEVDLAPYSNDLSAYIHAKGTPAQIATFDAFQLQYTSSRNVVTWTDKTRGLIVPVFGNWDQFKTDLKKYL
jgi:hypothetical protein